MLSVRNTEQQVGVVHRQLVTPIGIPRGCTLCKAAAKTKRIENPLGLSGAYTAPLPVRICFALTQGRPAVYNSSSKLFMLHIQLYSSAYLMILPDSATYHRLHSHTCSS